MSCKAGSYKKVLDELIKMNLSQKNVAVLFGQADILVQIRGLKGVDEFITNWFNPIRALTPKEPLVEKTQTLIVISEGRPFEEEPYAFLFFNTQPRNLEKLQETLQNIPGVLSADTVFGPYDVICAVRVRNKIELKQLVERIEKKVPDVQGIVTEIIAPLY
ncbi:MAG: Lrp/AsnC ligand binding domain-containing protein [Candidatus Bathyarchaeota archaeon]|nr:Lrp/AsnC ligand binding domain-containing protein [Candidatus Bathyarchaeota archaeon]